MKKIALFVGLFGSLLLSGSGIAQERDPASPQFGNPDHGRMLMTILGPKPQGTPGISPLQQQELNRRVRCAAIRQQIQDQLDLEAAGSTGFYAMPQLRAMEQETCAQVQQEAPLRPVALQPSPPPSTYQPPSQALTYRAPLQQPEPPPQPRVAQPAAPQPPVKPPTKQLANAQPYTPAPNYPQDEMAAGHEGVVVVQLVMNADGSVKSASIAQSCKFPILDASALAAARTWRIPAAAGRTIVVPLKFSAH